MQVPIQGGGAAGAPGQSPMQVPMAPSAVQGAAGGGQLVQPAAAAPTTPAPPAVAAAPTTPAPSAGAQPVAPVTGGGAIDVSALVPVLTQLVTALNGLVGALSGAGAVQGGGGGGVPTQSGGCGHAGCAHGQAGAAGIQQASSESRSDGPASGANAAPQAAPASAPAPGAAGGNGKLDGEHTVKGKKMSAEQKRLTEIVLRVGKDMGANRKVLETAVATMIQESTIKNDSSVDSKDHDSLGLFQQRPSQGWGTREQISNPEYAARKFFEKAIPNDRKDPGLAKTRLAQSVQISAYPDAYAKWDQEAEKIVADFLG